MKIIKGIYAEAEIFTDDVEEYAQAQVKMICDNEVAAGSKICMMPDIHPGKVAPIGLSMMEGSHKDAYLEDVKNRYTVSEFKKEMKGICSSRHLPLYFLIMKSRLPSFS